MHTNAQPLRAVIYTRVSADRSKRARSPEEQEAEIRAVCERNGWPIAEEVLSDNDMSASRRARKERPAYKRLKEILRPGDVLVTWASSRAQRDLEAYVELRRLCADRGVLWCYSGRVYDLTERGDRMATGFQAIIDEDYTDAIQEAALRAQRANAITGVAHGKIPYGYKGLRNPDTGKIEKRVPHETQAPIVREMVRRALAGEPIYAIAMDLNRRGVPTAKPSRGWTASSISALVKRPTYAGLRTHHGEVTSTGDWEPLISREDHDALISLMADAGRITHSGVEPKYLLSGIAVCGVCAARTAAGEENPGRIRRTSGKYPKYSCVKFCVSRRQPLVDLVVEEVLLRKLETVVSVDELADPEQGAALEEARTLRKRLEEAVDQFTEGDLTAVSLARVEARLLPRIKELERKGQKTVPPEVQRLLGPEARSQWADMLIHDRRIVVQALISVTINRSKPGGEFDPNSVRVEWI